MCSKNVKNFCSAGSGAIVTYETFTLPTVEIKFPSNPGEDFDANFVVRANPATPGMLPGITFTRIGNIVTLLIPQFKGDLAIGNTAGLMRIVTAGDIPSRFIPVNSINYPIDAWNNSSYINANQDHADLVIGLSGTIDLIARSFLWDGNCGLGYDLSVSWLV